jgi:hypothetical protein
MRPIFPGRIRPFVREYPYNNRNLTLFYCGVIAKYLGINGTKEYDNITYLEDVVNRTIRYLYTLQP